MSVPREVDYSSRPTALPPNTINTDIVIAPSNGSSFSNDGDIIQFQLPSRGFLVPSTMYLRYKCAVVTTTEKAEMRGTPFYTPFVRSQVSVGASVVESIEGYNQLANILVNTKMDVAEKTGLAFPLGVLDYATAPSTANINGRLLSSTTGETWDMAGALGNILSNADHLVPLGAMPSVQIQLTMDAVTNMFNATATGTNLSSLTLSNLELCFQSVEFGAEVDPMVLSMTDEEGNILIKSQSYTSSSQVCPVQTGQTELTFNQRLSSIKSIIANFNGAGNQENDWADSVDITSNLGDYQFLIANRPYPVRPMSVLQNKGGVYQELANCWSMAHSLYSSKLAIIPSEFQGIDVTATTYDAPSKFYIAQNTEKLSSSAMLTGVSSQLSPISLRINFGGQAPTNAHAVALICCFDAIMVINPLARQVVIRQ
tara:strand:- start:4974 stop:6254 length:1281 start_codon:yes stop_codon:yes gene_type:complete